MEKTILKETTDILKRLSPNNQAYFMTLVKVAETAENGVKGLTEQSHKPPENRSA